MKVNLKISLIFTLLLITPARAEDPKRVISIGGGITEIVYALGAESLLVGSDTTSYYPPAAERLPKVGYHRALSAEGILSLRPDLVLMTDEAGPSTVLEQLRAAGLRLLTQPAARSVAGVMDNIRAVGQALNRTEQADDLMAQITAEQDTLSKKTAGPRQKVMFVLQHGAGAPQVAGTKTAADSMIRLSGADNVVQGYSGYKPLTPEAAIALQPDIILVTTQSIKQAGGRESMLKTPALALTPAAQQGKLVVIDALLMIGFGPRTVQAALQLNNEWNTP